MALAFDLRLFGRAFARGFAFVPLWAAWPVGAQAPADASPSSVETGGGAGTGIRRGSELPVEIERFIVRDGYQVTIAVPSLHRARFLAFDPTASGENGVLYVSVPTRGQIIACRDKDSDGVFESQSVHVSDMPTVHAMQVVSGELFFATSGGIYRVPSALSQTPHNPVPVIAPPTHTLPHGGGHWWRSLLVTDKHIYTSIGDSGNITDQTETDRQKIFRFDRDGSNKTLFASGIRNTEKLQLRPGTDEVWGLDHGSDWFGKPLGDTEDNHPITDLNPPDELNRYELGKFYGHPFVTGRRIPRYEYLERKDIHELCAKTTPPEMEIPAHWATNGFTFLAPEFCGNGRHMPADHAGDLILAAHGSWNSSTPVGYCVARVLFDKGKPYGLLPLVTTITADGEVLARPVDCVQLPDGSVLFSSNAPGRVYRLRYVGTGEKPAERGK